MKNSRIKSLDRVDESVTQGDWNVQNESTGHFFFIFGISPPMNERMGESGQRRRGPRRPFPPLSRSLLQIKWISSCVAAAVMRFEGRRKWICLLLPLLDWGVRDAAGQNTNPVITTNIIGAGAVTGIIPPNIVGTVLPFIPLLCLFSAIKSGKFKLAFDNKHRKFKGHKRPSVNKIVVHQHVKKPHHHHTSEPIFVDPSSSSSLSSSSGGVGSFTNHLAPRSLRRVDGEPARKRGRSGKAVSRFSKGG
ncbi:unnamed protein product [Darwinula stevensoni]|uniref:Uncharacterized protein n=1 Tax=Darwinula stevensoni TaxID=69355 RepID=A0A7R9AE30_9CRUS|nr:unnamed protein product [Darwinula stevensoni]CAG0901657.1 unnamed protein product [Darwinula stevensoni]